MPGQVSHTCNPNTLETEPGDEKFEVGQALHEKLSQKSDFFFFKGQGWGWW